MIKTYLKPHDRLKLLEIVGLDRYEEVFKIILPDFVIDPGDLKETADTGQ